MKKSFFLLAPAICSNNLHPCLNPNSFIPPILNPNNFIPPTNPTIFIQNEHLPICMNCIHFKEYPNNYPYDDVPDKTKHLSTCKMFGSKNLVTGNIDYELASTCRKNENMCGKNARYYKAKNINENTEDSKDSKDSTK